MLCGETDKRIIDTSGTTLKITLHLGGIRTLALTPSRTLNTLNLLSRVQPADGADLHATGAQHFSTSETSRLARGRCKAIRPPKHRHHKTVEPISDFINARREARASRRTRLLASGVQQGFLREERLACFGAPIAHLRKDVHYGQFLQVPKGQRHLSEACRSNAGSLIAAIIVLAIIAAVVYFL